MNIFKFFYTVLFSFIGLVLSLPADAAVAVRKQALNKSTQSGSSDRFTNTDTHTVNSMTIGGAKSATFSAGQDGHSHLYVYDDVAGREIEVDPVALGFEYDPVPQEVATYMQSHPTATFEDAYEACNLSIDKKVHNIDMFWEKVTIFICNDEYYDMDLVLDPETRGKSVNSTFRMTGGTLGGIVIAGDRYCEKDDLFTSYAPTKTSADCDKGTVNVYISGGNIGYVAPSTKSTKYFNGTANIYMQNCHYTGAYIPNFYDSQDYATTTILVSGVTYDLPYENAVITTDTSSKYVSVASYSILQSRSGRTVTCASTGSGYVNLPNGILPVECDTFIVKTNTKVSSYATIDAGRFVMQAPMVINPLGAKGNVQHPMDATAITFANYFTNYKGGVVNAGYVNIPASSTVTNLGTFNVQCNQYNCDGTWSATYRYPAFLGQPSLTVFCNPAVLVHKWRYTYTTKTNPVVNKSCSYRTANCSNCSLAGPDQWFYNGAYFDMTDATVFNGTQEIVCQNSMRYQRTFSNTDYQPFYIPFSVPYVYWNSYADMYRIKNIHEYDDNNDGTVDRWTLEVLKMKDGEATKPNTPYVIKPKAAATVTFKSYSGKTLYATDQPKSIDCRSTDNEFVFTGTPVSKTIVANTDLYMSADGICYGTRDVTLGAYRWYMSIYDRETGEKIIPSLFNAAKRISIFCEEDGEDATGTLYVEEEENVIPSDAIIYDLNGQKVSQMIEGKIYIINGKKYKK